MSHVPCGTENTVNLFLTYYFSTFGTILRTLLFLILHPTRVSFLSSMDSWDSDTSKLARHYLLIERLALAFVA